jgi:basic membrane protein A
MYQDGADVIYTAAGDSGTGVYEAADDLSVADGTHLWAIGVDTDQYFVGGINEAAWQEHILTSMVKRTDVAVYETLEDEAEEAFTPGSKVFDLASGGVELSYSGGYIEPYRSQLEDLRDMIVAGDIEVPCVPASRAAQAAELGLTGC